jgi:serine/threonine protein kinase
MEFGEGKIGGKYAVGPKIGSGSFGEVYLVNNFGTEEIYAMKKEDEKAKHLQLMSEAKIIKNIEGSLGFSRVYWQGNEYKSNLMVMDLLGPSIEDLFVMCGKKFTLKTTLMLADQFVLLQPHSCSASSGCTPRTTSTATSNPRTSSWDWARSPTSCTS